VIKVGIGGRIVRAKIVAIHGSHSGSQVRLRSAPNESKMTATRRITAKPTRMMFRPARSSQFDGALSPSCDSDGDS